MAQQLFSSKVYIEDNMLFSSHICWLVVQFRLFYSINAHVHTLCIALVTSPHIRFQPTIPLQMSFGDQPDSSATSTQDAAKDALSATTAVMTGSPDDTSSKMADSALAPPMTTSGTPGTVQLLNADGTSTTATTMVVSVNSAPTASETEAANILTTIKSGELLSLQNADLLAAAGSGSDNIM